MDIVTDGHGIINGLPIVITTKTVQRRKHHKKRINKKWLERYGCWEFEMLPPNMYCVFMEGTLYMKKSTFEELIGLRGKDQAADVEHDKNR